MGLIAFFKLADDTVWLYCMRFIDADGLTVLSIDNLVLGQPLSKLLGV